MADNTLSTFFEEIARMIEESEVQYGVAIGNYTDYILDRQEFAITVCCNHKLQQVEGLISKIIVLRYSN